MASQIDATKPVTGNPTTQSVRDNFSAAKSEIEALQTDTLQNAANIAQNATDISQVASDLADHESDTTNPHQVTAAQVGADPSGSAAAVQSNLDAHEADTANPHQVTVGQIGAEPAFTDASDKTVTATGAAMPRTLADHLATLPDTKITATGGTTPRTLANRFAATFNIADYYGAAGTDTDEQAIQAAIDAAEAAGGGLVLGEPGETYAFTSGVTVDGDNVLLDFRGATLEFGGTGAETDFISFLGSVETATDVTGDVARNDTVLPLTSVAGLSVGDFLYILVRPAILATIRWSLVAEITDITGNDVTIHTRMPFPIDADADTITIQKANLLRGGGVRNATIDFSTFAGTISRGIVASWTTGQVFENIIGRDGGDAGLKILGGYANRASNLRFYECGGIVGNEGDFSWIDQTSGDVSDLLSHRTLGFGPKLWGGSYNTVRGFRSHEAQGGRGMKFQSELFGAFSEIECLNSSATGISIPDGTQCCAFSNLVAVGCGGTTEAGVWLNGDFTDDNVFTGVVARQNGSFDIADHGDRNVWSGVKVTALDRIHTPDGSTSHFSDVNDAAVWGKNNGAGSGPDLVVARHSDSPADNDSLGNHVWRGTTDAGGAPQNMYTITCRMVDSADATRSGRLEYRSIWNGATQFEGIIGNGWAVGNPTGGANGVGNLNVEGDIYQNNAAYTHPDYVFEREFTGKVERFAHHEGALEYSGRLSLDDLDAHIREYYRLPNITDEPMGMFARGDKALEKIEELTLYILELHKRIRALEAR